MRSAKRWGKRKDRPAKERVQSRPQKHSKLQNYCDINIFKSKHKFFLVKERDKKKIIMILKGRVCWGRSFFVGLCFTSG